MGVVLIVELGLTEFGNETINERRVGVEANNELKNFLRLWLADGIGAKLFYRLVDYFGSLEEAVEADMASLLRVNGIGHEKAKSIVSITTEKIDDEIAIAEKEGVDILYRGHSMYPRALETMYDPPPVLYVKGLLEREDAIAIAVVGSRKCTHYGVEQASRFGGALARSGFTIVSGGARGIDTAAHRSALDSGGRTIAVMGCGLNWTYPRENKALFSRIVDQGAGALISELPMNAKIMSGNFPKRNRIISGLTLGVLVVEAAVRSGAMITARLAMQQNREVFALPGRVDMHQSSGTHALIKDGANLVTRPTDIFDLLGEVGSKMRGDDAENDINTTMVRSDIKLESDEAKLFAIVNESPAHLDDIANKAEIDVGKAASVMTMLVLKGVVAQQPGNVFARK